MMRQFLVALALLWMAVSQSYAANTPCSGRKGGISHCQGAVFVCHDGSVSASKKNCSVYMGGSAGLGVMDGGSSSRMAPSTSGDCSCRSGSYCVGPRGGHYCITDSGRKSYLKR